MRIAFIAAVMLAIAGCSGSDEPTARADLVGPQEFAARMEEPDAAVINVHIPYEGELEQTDAFIPYDKIRGDSALPKDKNTPILLYCRSGNMSEEAGAVLHEDGYTNVAHLEGGMKAWEAAGHKLVHNPAQVPAQAPTPMPRPLPMPHN